jgi:hypothetical protein
MNPSDAFCSAFDSIEVDPARAPTPAAIDAAMALVAPIEQPGFYLLDDADGRFVVDPEFGFISLRDEALLESERGQVHLARLKVVEASGVAYELKLRLRLSGRVPQVVSESDAPAATLLASAPWAHFTGFLGASVGLAIGDEHAPFALLTGQPTHANVAACKLSIAAAPAPASAHATWSL